MIKKSQTDIFFKGDNTIMDSFFTLRAEEDFKAAFKILVPLSKKHTQDYRIFFLLGAVLYQDGDFLNAIKYLEMAVLLKPDYHLSSLCLIHTLSELGEWYNRFLEIRRFLRIGSKKQKEHRFLLKEIISNIANFNKSERAAIKRLQNEFLHLL